MKAPERLAKNLAATAILLFALLIANAQDSVKTATPPERPKFSSNLRSVNVTKVDDVVTQSFTLLKTVDDVSFKVQAIKSQLQTSGVDPASLVSQIDECSGALGTIGKTAPALVESLADMISNYKTLNIPIMKIPATLKNLNEARKAIQYSVTYAKYLITSIIPGMKKLKETTPVPVADSAAVTVNQ